MSDYRRRAVLRRIRLQDLERQFSHEIRILHDAIAKARASRDRYRDQTVRDLSARLGSIGRELHATRAMLDTVERELAR